MFLEERISPRLRYGGGRQTAMKDAFTPQADRNTIAPPAGFRTPVTKAVRGLQIQARIADDPLRQARIVIRMPDDWNGRLVVAGASGTRSEFNGDFAWSDYIVQKGYANVSQNKGTYKHTFRKRGTFRYQCTLHSGMTGKVVVG